MKPLYLLLLMIVTVITALSFCSRNVPSEWGTEDFRDADATYITVTQGSIFSTNTTVSLSTDVIITSITSASTLSSSPTETSTWISQTTESSVGTTTQSSSDTTTANPSTTMTTTGTSSVVVDMVGPQYDGNKLLIHNVNGDASGSSESTGTLPYISTPSPVQLSKSNLSLHAFQIDPLREVLNPQSLMLPNQNPSKNINLTTSGTIGSTHTFNAYDFYNGTTYTVTATKVAENSVCMVFSENLSDVDINIASTISNEFENVIWNIVTTGFGTPSDVDSNSKVVLLYLDIQDEYSYGGGSYVGGYFYGGDLYSTSSVPDSNEMEIFYMDTDPSVPDSTEAFGTIAHEFQHMVNYNRNIFIEGSSTNQDTWINEGLSEAANDIYMKQNGYPSLSNRIAYWNSDPSCYQTGHPLHVWGGISGTNVLPNYAMSYLFFQYMRIHSVSGTSIYKDIIDGTDNDYQDVEAVASTELGTGSYEELLVRWRLANYYKNSAGIYGYGSEQANYNVNVSDFSGTTTTLSPGGAIYKSITGSFMPSGNDINIHFAGFD